MHLRRPRWTVIQSHTAHCLSERELERERECERARAHTHNSAHNLFSKIDTHLNESIAEKAVYLKKALNVLKMLKRHEKRRRKKWQRRSRSKGKKRWWWWWRRRRRRKKKHFVCTVYTQHGHMQKEYISERRGKQLRAIRMAKLFHFVTRSLHIAFVIRMNWVILT